MDMDTLYLRLHTSSNVNMELSATFSHARGLETRGPVPMHARPPSARPPSHRTGNHPMNYSSPTPISLTANTRRHTVEYGGRKTDAKTSADVKTTK